MEEGHVHGKFLDGFGYFCELYLNTNKGNLKKCLSATAFESRLRRKPKMKNKDNHTKLVISTNKIMFCDDKSTLAKKVKLI